MIVLIIDVVFTLFALILAWPWTYCYITRTPPLPEHVAAARTALALLTAIIVITWIIH